MFEEILHFCTNIVRSSSTCYEKKFNGRHPFDNWLEMLVKLTGFRLSFVDKDSTILC